MNQLTLKEAFTVTGKGLHSGLEITATFKPAPENHGYKFQRIDLEDMPIIDALAENVVETTRGTVIGKKDAKVSTIEHALAALYAAGIDNCLIEVNAPEMPILDGSALHYVEEIERVGVEEQNADKDFYIIKQKTTIRDEETGSMITIYPDEHFSVQTMVEYNSPIIPNQFAVLDELADFKKEVSSARTFVFVREIEQLLNHGLIKGGDLENAIVIYDRPLEQEQIDGLCDLIGMPHRKLDKLGYINETPLKWDNEPARHKLLDVIGDLALIGRPLKGRVVAVRPGHTINNKFTRMLRKEVKHTEVQAPIYDPNKPALIDNNGVRSLLPHRYPFLLIDKVIEIDQKHIVSVKNVTTNEPFFQGHFPDEPIMPGVLIVEAMAQVAAIAVLAQVAEPKSYSTYFLRIDNVRFKRKVVPGDTMQIECVLAELPRRGVANVECKVFVGGTLACEATIMAQIVKNR
jgi:UDP-3-O-[3-hydroxymyristoyl] N-acetylglucosamine deacetylase/3-hydroxyacyl-[acyl-carrier-protein] dehydratase